MELWDALTWKPIKYFGVHKDEEIGDLLAVSWHSEGTQFVTTHKEGSFMFWDVGGQSKPLRITKPHGIVYHTSTELSLYFVGCVS